MKTVFWLSVLTILYVYVGYPCALAVIARWRKRLSTHHDQFLPTVSLIIAAYNEEKVLAEKLDNSLALDYPKDRLEIVVASDGSTDSTNAIARAYGSRGVVLYEVAPRGGKSRVLNLVVPKTKGEILILSDANAMYQPDAIRKMVRHFADPTVGGVTGCVELIDACDTYAPSEGLYYRYERFLQKMESRVWSIIGADGAMYAVRRDAFDPPSDSIILDDFVISMNVARQGLRVLYEPEAVAKERGTVNAGEEFRRKVRIVAGGIQAIQLGEGLPRFTQPLLLFCYWSHKLLRWLLPVLFVAIVWCSIVLAQEPVYRLALIAQGIFYGLAVGYALGVFRKRPFTWVSVPYYFCLVNLAALVGLWKGLRGTQQVTWQRTTR